MATINFNDAIFAQEALTAFAASLTPIATFSHNYSGEAKKKGAAISVPRFDVLSTTTFSYSNNSGVPYEGEGGTISTVTISLDQHIICPFDMTDKQNCTATDWITFAHQQGKALGKAVIQSVWSSLTTANFGLPVVSLAIADYGTRALAKARAGLVKRDVPLEGLSVVVNEDANHYLLADPGFSNAAYYGGSEAIREGKIPAAYGMNVFSSNIIPTNGISLAGFVAHPDAIAVAMRYLEPQAPQGYISAIKLVDPGSGIAMGYRRHYSPGKGIMYSNLECLFGHAVGLTLGLGLLTRLD